jgi:hypothetical protein
MMLPLLKHVDDRRVGMRLELAPVESSAGKLEQARMRTEILQKFDKSVGVCVNVRHKTHTEIEHLRPASSLGLVIHRPLHQPLQEALS